MELPLAPLRDASRIVNVQVIFARVLSLVKSMTRFVVVPERNQTSEDASMTTPSAVDRMSRRAWAAMAEVVISRLHRRWSVGALEMPAWPPRAHAAGCKPQRYQKQVTSPS